jgi:hypothetical protein
LGIRKENKMRNYDIRMFRNSLTSYIKQSPIEPEVKFLVLRDLTAQAEKDADAMVVREASELEKAEQLKKNAGDKAAEQRESEV